MKKDLLIKRLLLVFIAIIIVITFFLLSHNLSNIIELFQKKGIDEKKITVIPINSGQDKGIFINIWFRNEKQLDRFVKNNIKYLFVDAGHIEKNGRLTTSEEELRSFMNFIEKYEERENFDFILLPYNEIILEDYDFTSMVFRNNVLENHLTLIELGFDGVHIDIEAIPLEQRKDYLDFLEKIRENIEENKLLTVYAGTLDEKPNKWEWDSEFYSEVSNRVDIISAQNYDFGFNDKKNYQKYLEEQINQLASRQWNSKIFFTAPTHKPYPETLKNALEVYSEVSENPFDGTVIFAEWTTDESEWDLIELFL
jgi:hypothetical protein